MKHLYESVFSGALMALMIATPLPSHAQSPQAPTPAEAQAALNPAPAPFTDAQLDQMLAPIALYPDQLLTQVLMAATFPQELVDAQKWLQDSHNASLKGDDLANALQSLPWDPSVKSLVAFPQVIAMMTNHLDWTEALGAAFANQQVLVFSRVQFLRQRASKSGMLQSNAQIAVSDQDSDIIIQPTDPTMLSVPVYNPADVYGMWPDSDYPPVFLPPPPGFYPGAIGAGIGFSVGFGIVAPLWGWGHPDWHDHSVVVDPGGYRRIAGPSAGGNAVTIEGGTWHHSGPVAAVPANQRPASTYQSSAPPPHGTVAPNQAARPAAAGAAAPAGGPHPAGQPATGAPAAGPHPAGQPATGAPAGQPATGAPAGQPATGAPAGQPATGAPAHPEEAHPGAPPPHPEEHAAPPPHPEAPPPPPHPEEHVAAPPHPEAPPPPHPEEHAAPPPHPEAPPPPPHPEEHAAPPPHPAAPPPPPPPHPAAPPPPPPAAHPPAAPPPHPAPAKPEEKKDDQH